MLPEMSIASTSGEVDFLRSWAAAGSARREKGEQTNQSGHGDLRVRYASDARTIRPSCIRVSPPLDEGWQGR